MGTEYHVRVINWGKALCGCGCKDSPPPLARPPPCSQVFEVPGRCEEVIVQHIDPSFIVDVTAVPAGHLPGNASCVEYNFNSGNQEVCLDTRPCNLADPDRGEVLCLGEGEDPTSPLDILRLTQRHGNCVHVNIQVVAVKWM